MGSGLSTKGWTLDEFADFVENNHCTTFSQCFELLRRHVSFTPPVSNPTEVKGFGRTHDGRIVLELYIDERDSLPKYVSFSEQDFNLSEFFIARVKSREPTSLMIEYVSGGLMDDCLRHGSAILRFGLIVAKILHIEKVRLLDESYVKCGDYTFYLSIMQRLARRVSLYESVGFKYDRDEKELLNLRSLSLQQALFKLKLPTTNFPPEFLTIPLEHVATKFLSDPKSQKNNMICRWADEFTERIHKLLGPRTMELDLRGIALNLSDYCSYIRQKQH